MLGCQGKEKETVDLICTGGMKTLRIYGQKHQRCRNRQEAENIQVAFKRKRKELRKAIKYSKKKSFKLLRNDLQNKPWGNAYKIVMHTIKGISSKAPTYPVIMENIVTGLFPQHETLDFNEEL